MSADITFPVSTSSSSTKNPFEAARRKLISQLLAMKAPAAYPNFPSPSDHEGIASHIREAAQIFDEWLNIIGMHVADNSTTEIDMRAFEGAFTGAIEGNATYACESAAEALREGRRAA